MMVINCPCCGEKYYSDSDFIEQQRFFCEKCCKKFVFINNRFIPYIVENLVSANESIGSCPFCGQIYSFDADMKGTVSCMACRNYFYVGERNEIHVNPASEDTLTISGIPKAFDREDVPIKIIPVNPSSAHEYDTVMIQPTDTPEK
ncbi:MAG: hypothetical protein IKB71_05715 [Lentisphaeria bacterium]|nr:hypothetical protein [Lentisphaeria bacterium]